MLMSLVTAIDTNYPGLVNDYIQTDDARANIFWFHKLLDKKLFLNDFFIEYKETGAKKEIFSAGESGPAGPIQVRPVLCYWHSQVFVIPGFFICIQTLREKAPAPVLFPRSL